MLSVLNGFIGIGSATAPLIIPSTVASGYRCIFLNGGIALVVAIPGAMTTSNSAPAHRVRASGAAVPTRPTLVFAALLFL